MTRMKFNVKAHKSWPVKSRNFVKQAANWGIKRLKIDMQPITVLFRFMGENLEDSGSCLRMSDDKYIIHLYARKSLRSIISTVFHELTHVKQHIYDNFHVTHEGIMWKTFYYPEYKQNYWNDPWEIDARASEIILRKEFFTSLKNSS